MVVIDNKSVTLNGSAAVLVRRIVRFGPYMADPDFNGTFIYRIAKGELMESKFEQP